MTMMIFNIISSQTVRTADHTHHLILTKMKIINPRASAGLKIVSNFKILTIKIIMIAIMVIAKTLIIAETNDILRLHTK